MSFSAIKVRHNWCLQFIDEILTVLYQKKLIFQHNKLFTVDKFEEIYYECGGYEKEGITYAMWSDEESLRGYCFNDISSLDSRIISCCWQQFIQNKLEESAKEIKQKKNRMKK